MNPWTGRLRNRVFIASPYFYKPFFVSCVGQPAAGFSLSQAQKLKSRRRISNGNPADDEAPAETTVHDPSSEASLSPPARRRLSGATSIKP